MKKIVKLTERDLRSIVNKVKRVISEQGIPTYEKTDKGVPPYPQPERDDEELGEVTHGDEGGVKVGPPPPVSDAKRAVAMNLSQALSSMKMLVNLSGVNTEIPDDIEKVIEKFNTLYGHQQKKIEKNK